MTASCPSTVRVKEHFKVKYVLLNNLQDFLAVRLVWTPDSESHFVCVCVCSLKLFIQQNSCATCYIVYYVGIFLCLGRGQGEDASLSAVICHTPLSNLGQCRKGSTLSFSVAFQILKPGLYEVCPL